jgi:hypothetical protein
MYILQKKHFKTCIFHEDVPGDFENCTGILTCDRTSQKIMTEPVMPYKSVDIFREHSGSKKKHIRLFCYPLIQN